MKLRMLFLLLLLVPLASIQTAAAGLVEISDNFNDNSLNTERWEPITSGTGVVSESNQQLNLKYPSYDDMANLQYVSSISNGYHYVGQIDYAVGDATFYAMLNTLPDLARR